MRRPQAQGGVTADGLFEREDGAIKSLAAAACQITDARRSDPLLQ